MRRVLSKHGSTILLVAGGMFVTFVVAFPFLIAGGASVFATLMQAEAAALHADLQGELGALTLGAQAIAARDDVRAAIEGGRSGVLTDLLRREKMMRRLGFVTAVDERGVVIADTDAPERRGSHLFATTPWGRLTGIGQPAVMFGVDEYAPLFMVAGEPIAAGGLLRGAVFVGLPLTDEFAALFAAPRLRADSAVAFYSRTEGIVGSSFADQHFSHLIRAYFNAGSDWVLAGRSGNEVRMGGRYFLVENVPLLGQSGEALGGTLYFFEVNHARRSFFLALLLTAFYIIVVEGLSRRTRERSFLRAHRKVFLGSAVGLMLALFLAHQIFLDRAAFPIRDVPYILYNATLRLRPSYGVFDRGAGQLIAVDVETGGEAVNAVGVVLRFDPERMVVEDIVTERSFCLQSLFLEKIVDNRSGAVRIACGLPNPGLRGKGTVAELVIVPKERGVFSLRFVPGETRVLANDGLGTDVLRSAIDGSYEIVDAPRPAAQSEGVPRLLLFSPSHPNREVSYNDRDVHITWPAYPGYEFVYGFDQSSTSLPTQATTTADEIVFHTDRDGTYYFHIAARREGVAGPVSHLKVSVDTTPPRPPSIRASATEVRVGEVVRFDMSADDGADLAPSYYVRIGGGTFFPVGPQLFVPFLEPGDYLVTVRVFDRAGNTSDGNIVIRVTGKSFFERLRDWDFLPIFR